MFISEIDHKYHYLYKITNKITGQYYYGVHSTKNINDNYMGSGTVVKKSIKLYGISAFSKEYIQFYNSVEEMLTAERELVNEDILKDPMCMNVLIGGGGLNFKGYFPAKNKITGEIKAVKKEDMLGDEWEHITTGRKRMQKNINGETLVKYVYKNEIQAYEDDGWTTKCVGNVAGKVKINKCGQVKYIKPDQLQQYIDEGWTKGGLPLPCKGSIRIIHPSGSEKMIAPDQLQQYIDEGWSRGSNHKGRIHIYKDALHKMVHKYELDDYLRDGWLEGTPNHSILGKIKIVKNWACKVIDPRDFAEYSNDGWVRGSIPTTSGKIRINKDGKCKCINPDELDEYLKNGWARGRKNIHKS